MILLIIQRRPVIDKNNSLETPGGQVDKGETPLESIKKELREELGMSFEIVENICVLEPDVGRLMNKLYVFKAEKPKKIGDPEKGIKIMRIKPEKVFNLINEKELTNAYSIAALSIVLRRFQWRKNIDFKAELIMSDLNSIKKESPFSFCSDYSLSTKRLDDFLGN